MVIEKVDFDLNLGQIAQQSSQIIADKVFTNDSDHEEAVPFEVSHHVEETSLFEHGDGFIIEPNTAFKSACLIEMNGPDFLTPYNLGGIPFLTDGKIEVGCSGPINSKPQRRPRRITRQISLSSSLLNLKLVQGRRS